MYHYRAPGSRYAGSAIVTTVYHYRGPGSRYAGSAIVTTVYHYRGPGSRYAGSAIVTTVYHYRAPGSRYAGSANVTTVYHYRGPGSRYADSHHCVSLPGTRITIRNLRLQHLSNNSLPIMPSCLPQLVPLFTVPLSLKAMLTYCVIVQNRTRNIF